MCSIVTTRTFFSTPYLTPLLPTASIHIPMTLLQPLFVPDLHRLKVCTIDTVILLCTGTSIGFQAFCSYVTGTLATQAVLKGLGVGDKAASAAGATVMWLLRGRCRQDCWKRIAGPDLVGACLHIVWLTVPTGHVYSVKTVPKFFRKYFKFIIWLFLFLKNVLCTLEHADETLRSLFDSVCL